MAAKKEPTVNIILEFDGKSVNVADVSKAAKENWKKKQQFICPMKLMWKLKGKITY